MIDDAADVVERRDGTVRLGRIAVAVPALIEGLKDKETFWQAARTLGRLGRNSPEAVAALKAMAQEGEGQRRDEAESALAAIREPRAPSEGKS